jgi:hypothetical protein
MLLVQRFLREKRKHVGGRMKGTRESVSVYEIQKERGMREREGERGREREGGRERERENR